MTGQIDAGIHSLKDMPSFLPEGLALDHVFPREDLRDAFLSNRYETLDALPPGAIVGTSSLRRQAMILAKRPDLKIVPFRGNVPTRIEKLRAEQVDATLLAVAGLKRLDLTHEIAAILEPEDMLPAAGQGIVGIETRTDDLRTRNLFDPLHCSKTGLCAAAERAALQALDGSCHTPIGAHAVFADGRMHLHVMVAAPDGGNIWTAQETENVTDREEAAALGRKLGSLLEKQVPAEVLGR